ncbi:nucleotidyltransferase family protein [Paracoccus sp. TK19116]|uniref:Nucleotidyltransferase family protein n=1 Tax=Paracoccus albicereus TaxID=2922394 RepID=A0ABT1MU96_9RHOB|nr:nucleotidyltransferase family protein [Paracoccus albicereus]MCQ0971909.1 nucleotidyltransferase family protein [Paracoccus albicereus]
MTTTSGPAVMGLLLAAGQGTRFGSGNKLLADWDGRPVVTAAALALRRAVDGPCVAVVRDARVAALLPGFIILRMTGPAQDMAASLHRGIAHAAEIQAGRALVVLGDMPCVPVTHLMRLVRCATDSRPAASGHDGRPGVPACLPARLFSTALAASGDMGARRLLTDAGALTIPLAPRARHDIDRPEDLRRLSHN